MKIIINKKDTEAVWVDYNDDVKFLLRPVTMSILIANADNIAAAKQGYMYGLVDWQGIVDAKGKDLECNDDYKEHIYEYNVKVATWILMEINKLSGAVEDELKN